MMTGPVLNNPWDADADDDAAIDRAVERLDIATGGRWRQMRLEILGEYCRDNMAILPIELTEE